MYVKSINMANTKNKILWFIILGALMVASCLIIVTIIYIGNDENVKSPIDTKGSIFIANHYTTTYEVNITSNKNNNKYMINESYTNNDGNESFMFKTQNENQESVEYMVENNTLKIKSENQNTEYSLSEYIVKKRNLLSISTFINIYNNIEEFSKISDICSKIEVEEIDQQICYRIVFGNDEKCECSICGNSKDIRKEGIEVSKMELIVSKKDKQPLQYIIYDKEAKGYIDIIFKEFSF